MVNDPLDREMRRRIRRVEVIIEDHVYGMEDENELCLRRKAKAVPSEVAGAPGYMIDGRGRVYRVWRRDGSGGLETLKEPEEVPVRETSTEGRDPLGLVRVEQPVRGPDRLRSVYAMMVKMQHPELGRYVTVKPLRERADAKYDLLVTRGHPEPEPEPDKAKRMVFENLKRKKIWRQNSFEKVNFPNHAVDRRGFVWRVTAGLPTGPGSRRGEMPTDARAALLPPERWTRVVLRVRSWGGRKPPRFVCQLHPKAGSAGRKPKVADAAKLVEAYFGAEAAGDAWAGLMAVHDPGLTAEAPGEGGKNLGELLRLGPRMASRYEKMERAMKIREGE